MKISHIEHLGIAVESIEAALPYYENVLGLKCYNIEEVADQKVKTAFLKVGEVKSNSWSRQARTVPSPNSSKKEAVAYIMWHSASKTVWPMLWLNVKKKASA